MKHYFLLFAPAFFFIGSVPAVVLADALGNAAPVSDEVLADQRGGFSWDGADITIGADVRTVINGALALETTLNMSAAGISSTKFVSSTLTLADAAALQANLRLPVSAFGGSPVYLTNGGQTAVVQRADNNLSNVIVNTASGTSIAQQIDVSVNLASYQAFRAGVASSALASSLSAAIAAATAASLGK